MDGLSLKMYKGQITALLGHNGAGKFSVMSFFYLHIVPVVAIQYFQCIQ